MQLCHISASFLKEEEILQLNKMPLASGNLKCFPLRAAEITWLWAHGQKGAADGNLQYISIKRAAVQLKETEHFLHGFYVWQVIHCYPVLKNLYSEVIRIPSDNNEMGHCLSQTSTP